jgi:hypothetical protein
MGSTRFGDADRAIVASAPPQDTAVRRGDDGCAMASDRM